MSETWKIESAALAAKVGSVLVHVEEAISNGGHAFDVIALEAVFRDPEVAQWLADLRSIALVPVPRRAK